MSKNIVLCSDGTGNKGGQGDVTNVWQLFAAIDLHGHRQPSSDLDEQIAFHDDGVGTHNFRPLKVIGGAFGWGLSENVRNLYLQLVRVYDPGDKIYLFGFSRGAYTVRLLAGLIVHCGIVDRWVRDNNGKGLNIHSDEDLKDLVKRAYKAYRKRFRKCGGKKKRKPDAVESFKTANGVTTTKSGGKDVRIKFIGVWDTVDAVGMPVDELADILNLLFRFRFPDKILHESVEKACHALAIDDERHTFHPVMWDEGPHITKTWWARLTSLTQGWYMRSVGGDSELAPSDVDPRRIEQVWFAGVHSNVGGGYPKPGMSLVSLDWMMQRAQEQGLRFIDSARNGIRQRANVHDKLYDSRAGLAIYYRYKPRNIGMISRDNNIKTPRIHYTVFNRIYMGTEGYAPGYIPKDFTIEITDPNSALRSQEKEYVEEIKDLVKRHIGNPNNNKAFDRVHRLTVARRVLNFVIAVTSAALAFQALSTLPAFANAGAVMDWLIGLGKVLFSPAEQMKAAVIELWEKQPDIIIVGLGILVVANLINVALLRSTRHTLQKVWNAARTDYENLLKSRKSGAAAKY